MRGVKYTNDSFKQEMITLYGNQFDYTFMGYQRMLSPIWLICNTCKELFTKTANEHKAKGKCPICSGYKNSKERIIQKFMLVHGNQYDYSNIEFTRRDQSVDILCNNCKIVFTQIVGDHLSGSGCPDCVGYGFKLNEPAILYYLRDNITGWYKIGITNRTLSERFGKQLKRFTIISIEKYDRGKEALSREQEVLKKFKNQRRTIENFGSGKTEFFEGDVLKLDNGLIL